MKRIALDLCCGQGGTTKGLLDAGFDEVVGVDKVDHSARYPGTFVQADAISFLAKYGHLFDFKIAGVPCQPFSISTAGNLPARLKYDRLIAAARATFEEVGGCYVKGRASHDATRAPRPLPNHRHLFLPGRLRPNRLGAQDQRA